MKIIDVREPFEYMLGHVKNSINIPLGKLSSHFDEVAKALDASEEIVVYCLSGNRAGSAVDIFKQHGFTQVVNGINKHSVEQNYL